LMPLLGSVGRIDLILPVFGTGVHWFKGIEAQLIEFRLYPCLAALCFLWTMKRLVHGRIEAIERAQGPFFAGFGIMSYSIMRFILLAAYMQMPSWADFWEEATEFIAIAGVALILWLFRKQLEISAKKEKEEIPDIPRNGI
jgi:hypothetical protein